jgi:hypothetical protein
MERLENNEYVLDGHHTLSPNNSEEPKPQKVFVKYVKDNDKKKGR